MLVLVLSGLLILIQWWLDDDKMPYIPRMTFRKRTDKMIPQPGIVQFCGKIF